MTPLQRLAILVSIVSSAGTALPAAVIAPLPGPAAPLFVISPALRALVDRLRVIDPQPRTRNWINPQRQGSCAHASLYHLLHWQGQHELAEWWKRNHAGGENPIGLAAGLTAARIPFAETRSGDVAFLEWAIRTRRGANVTVDQGSHMVTLVGLDQTTAHILDSNQPDRIQPLPRETFLAEWRAANGWGITPVFTPTPPSPWLVDLSKPLQHH